MVGFLFPFEDFDVWFDLGTGLCFKDILDVLVLRQVDAYREVEERWTGFSGALVPIHDAERVMSLQVFIGQLIAES